MRQDTHLQIAFLSLSPSLFLSRFFAFRFLAAFIRVADEHGRKRKEVQKSRFAHLLLARIPREARGLDRLGATRRGAARRFARNGPPIKKRDRPRVRRPVYVTEFNASHVCRGTTTRRMTRYSRACTGIHTSSFHRETYRVDQVRRIRAVIQTIGGIYIRPIE
jgi:hypothetical protein